MNVSTAQFTRGRVVALVLIGLVAVVLGYLHFDGDSDSVSVPSGAQEGQLTLEPCTYAGESAECGTLVVRENRHDPDSRLIAIPVKRIRAQSADAGVPVFGMYGGPGHSNFEFTAMTRFAGDRDVVLVGYRGVDGSVRLDCPEVVDSRESSPDWLRTSSLEADAAAFRACAERLREEGVDLAGYTIPQRIDDFELVRRKLGYGPIDLVSESFGTRVAPIYAWRYPTSIHRSVMVGANPPGHFFWNAKTTDAQLQRYALCADDESCRGRTEDLAATVHSEFDRLPRGYRRASRARRRRGGCLARIPRAGGTGARAADGDRGRGPRRERRPPLPRHHGARGGARRRTRSTAREDAARSGVRDRTTSRPGEAQPKEEL